MYETSVLIAGAGPTGLTLAIDLARRGIAFRLLEAVASPSEGSRGKGIQPRTLEIFDDLGIIDAVLAAGAAYPKFRIHAGRFSVRAGSLGRVKAATQSVPYPNVWMVPQCRTEAVLRQHLSRLGGKVEFGQALTTLSQDETGVTAELSTGETLRAKFLVGCDGGHSTVRRALGLRMHGELIEKSPLLVANIEVMGLDRDHWHVWPFAKGGAISLCPLPNTVLFELICKDSTAHTDLENSVQEITGHGVKAVVWKSNYRPAVRMVDRYRVRRAFLAGDAAHLHPPTGGQGLNTGIQDAYNLGWKLACVIRGGPDSLLDTYEAERLPIAAAVLGLSKRLYRSKSLRRSEVTNQLRLNYRSSSLSTGAAIGSLYPGDRMPDVRLDDGQTLFDRLRGPHATQLVTACGTRILIRPDGYIAQIGVVDISEYAGEPTRQIRVAVPVVGC